jgi:electron transfer flavoprotein alpha subunit
MKDVIAFIEHKGGAARRVSFEAATAARQIADQLGGKAHAVVVGNGAGAIAQILKGYPLDTIHVLDDASVDKAGLDPSVDALEAVAKSVGPAVVILGNTQIGRDVGSRFAARVDAGVTADVIDVKIEGGKVAAVSPKLGGLTITTCAFKNTDYGVIAIRPNVFAAKQAAGAGEIVAIAPSGKTYAVTVEEEVDEAAAVLGVEEASTVISGGRGMGGPEPSPMSSAERSEPRVRPLTRAGFPTVIRSDKPAKPSARISTSRSVFPARSSTRSGCAHHRRSSRSTRT